MSALRERMARGLRRYQCKGCGRTFNALSGTPLSGLHHKERWLSFGASLAKGETVKASCDVAVSTAFRWRHRFLLKGIVEADETYGRAGRARAGLDARHGGGAARRRSAASRASRCRFSWRQTGAGRRSACCPGSMRRRSRLPSIRWSRRTPGLLVSDGGASYPPCAAALGVSHEALNRSMGERVRGDLHVQTVNSRHSRLKDFLRPRRGIATRDLPDPVRPRRQRPGGGRIMSHNVSIRRRPQGFRTEFGRWRSAGIKRGSGSQPMRPDRAAGRLPSSTGGVRRAGSAVFRRCGRGHPHRGGGDPEASGATGDRGGYLLFRGLDPANTPLLLSMQL